MPTDEDKVKYYSIPNTTEWISNPRVTFNYTDGKFQAKSSIGWCSIKKCGGWAYSDYTCPHCGKKFCKDHAPQKNINVKCSIQICLKIGSGVGSIE